MSSAHREPPELPVAPKYPEQDSSQPRANGAGFRDEEEAVNLPHNNMGLVMAGLAITTFLASLDSTIVTTALPTIIAELGGTASDYSWTGISYMLCSGACIPLWGKLSDVVGRKAILYPCMALFLLGSGLCGAATSMSFLIACRAVQGLGGGGTVVMVQIVLSDIVSLRDRGKYSSVIGACWGVASVLGPLLGGILTEKVSWRWCFWINLPTGGVAAIMLLFLHLNPVKKMTLAEFFQKFDFWGTSLLMSGTGTLLAGFSIASDKGWKEPATIALIVAGPVLLALAAVVESKTTRMAVIPPRLLKTRTTLSLFGLTFLHAIGFMCTNFYLPVLFQGVDGDSALGSGIKMLPIALGGSLASIIAGPLVSVTKVARPFIWMGTILMTIGAGLLISLSEKSNVGMEMGYTLIQGIGTGFLFQPPLIALQAAMPLKDMAACTGAFYLVRTLGTTMGVSLGGVAFQSQLAVRLRAIPGLAGTSTQANILRGNYKDISRVAPAELRQQVIVALSRSLRTIFIMLLPLAAATILLSLLVRHYSLERNFVRQNEQTEEAPKPAPSVDIDEKGDV
ncbi:major facilitator superfamily domain-containing protein [Mycena belliarum]|uniref:Major facilitator superfamily domain-containing protein n=1 Tax=Mycena belliarum TaxID=1033014 RepID=A0AAD6XS74_9AGAR|nr:major facilitator superfamily domain-containing protein [Mycena belliae]